MAGYAFARLQKTILIVMLQKSKLKLEIGEWPRQLVLSSSIPYRRTVAAVVPTGLSDGARAVHTY